MKERYRVQEQELWIRLRPTKLRLRRRGTTVWGAIFSFGISAALSNKWAAEADAKAKHEHLEAIGKRENADIAFEAVSLVKGSLIPAVNNFISGLEVCAVFLSDSKERLEKMKLAGDKGPRKPYYIMMRNRAKELNTTCLQFLAVTDLMRNHMGAIPSVWMRIKSEVSRISNLAPSWKAVK